MLLFAPHWVDIDKRGIALSNSMWRDGRVAEGAPLLREYGVNSSIEGSNPSLSATLSLYWLS